MAFDPKSYFDPQQLAAVEAGQFGPLDMKPFSYPYQRPMWIEPTWGYQQAPESEKGIVLEKTFIYALCLGFVTALVLSYTHSPLISVLGGLVPVALWLAVITLGVSRRVLRWLFRNLWRFLKKTLWLSAVAWWHVKKSVWEYQARRALAVALAAIAKAKADAKAAEAASAEEGKKGKHPRALPAIGPDQRMTVEQAKQLSPERKAMEKRVLERLTGTGPKDKGQMNLPYRSEAERKKDPACVGAGIGWDCSSLMNFAWAPEDVDFKDCNAQMEFERQRDAGRILPEPASDERANKYLQPGDLLFFVNDKGEVKHVGMVESCQADGTVTMVEANHAPRKGDKKPSGVVLSPYVRVGSNHPRWAAPKTSAENAEYYLCASRPGTL